MLEAQRQAGCQLQTERLAGAGKLTLLRWNPLQPWAASVKRQQAEGRPPAAGAHREAAWLPAEGSCSWLSSEAASRLAGSAVGQLAVLQVHQDC